MKETIAAFVFKVRAWNYWLVLRSSDISFSFFFTSSINNFLGKNIFSCIKCEKVINFFLMCKYHRSTASIRGCYESIVNQKCFLIKLKDFSFQGFHFSPNYILSPFILVSQDNDLHILEVHSFTFWFLLTGHLEFSCQYYLWITTVGMFFSMMNTPSSFIFNRCLIWRGMGQHRSSFSLLLFPLLQRQ